MTLDILSKLYYNVAKLKEGGGYMGAEEKKIAQSITEAVSSLPEEKREYILGYAEGVIAMADRLRCNNPPPAVRDSA